MAVIDTDRDVMINSDFGFEANLRDCHFMLYMDIRQLCQHDLSNPGELVLYSPQHFQQIQHMSHVLFDEIYTYFKSAYFPEGFCFSARECIQTASTIRGMSIDELQRDENGRFTDFVSDLRAMLIWHGVTYYTDAYEAVLRSFWCLCWVSSAFRSRPHPVFAVEFDTFDGKRHDAEPALSMKESDEIRSCVFPGLESFTIISKSLVISM
jgi:hypothetical protein